jgi:hypothetical protein
MKQSLFFFQFFPLGFPNFVAEVVPLILEESFLQLAILLFFD